MKEKETLKRSKRSSWSGSWLSSLLIFLIIGAAILFFFTYFSSPDKKTFTVKKINDGEIEVYGLEEKEIDQID